MRTVKRHRRLSHAAATGLVGSRAPELPADDELRGPPVLVLDAEDGSPVLAIGMLTLALRTALHETLPGLPLTETLRANTGYRNASRVFGWSPRKPMFQRDSCHPTDMMLREPRAAAVLCDVADFCGAQMAEYLPDVVGGDTATLSPILPDWRITDGPGALWTSGVVNRNSPMPYHRDGNNFPTWSAMPVVRTNVSGGHLHLVDYDLVVPCVDGSVVYLWGQRDVHGVTPMRARPRVRAYRYTVVFYALRGMQNCAEFAWEQAEGRKRRTAREESLALNGPGGAEHQRLSMRSKATQMAPRDTGGGFR